MHTKSIKLSKKKDGRGYITSYTVNIGTAEARECGLVSTDGSPIELEKVIDTEHGQIIIRKKVTE
ncbi:hypothetical protein [Absicoccus intestinalis]|uniref:Xylan 1,4-beta-xylosidase n=1 Tax=Absicoccus intestinalis TaxID=2926319 RepID=A0ABU4WKA0_9FIRM|nr:hypothetical protein [Absicoccus sp. CLA-KB-P134]MDX8416972.1 hypothetical protein [Absicoccus sp. CLA-KB-P134]